MTKEEYGYIQCRLRRKLSDRKPFGMTGRRGEGYEAGIKAAMSIINEIYGEGEEAAAILYECELSEERVYGKSKR